MTLSLRGVTLNLHNHVLIKPVTLDIAAGEVVTLMGPSGCGKSSLLSYLGGNLEAVFTAQGEVVLGGQSVTMLPPEKRRIARLFQDDLLFPHMTVAENLLFAVPGGSRLERLRSVDAALQSADLADFGKRAPHTLSGGQRQRVALMRALLAKPAAILLDEPFSKLDAELRDQMRDYVFTHIQERAIPALLVTHDISDAPTKGRILTIKNAEVQDV